MSCILPTGNFELVNGEDISMNDIMNYNEDIDDVGYVLEVDLEYPTELHSTHNDYPLACENTIQKEIYAINYAEHSTTKIYIDHIKK